ncbi:MAG: type I restriction enzyme HsdR N-terminal domain-containing protein [Chitinophagaceae bacterium]|nr:type I restriction enzyme HsdR N-terminal domain-containing protein [Chitinophagaceae bacterium]
MIKIDYPVERPKIKQSAGRELIFDPIRKQWVVLTPEEWVRQNFLQYLVLVRKFPASLIAVEKEIRLGELKKRFDIVIYDQQTKPRIIIECKEAITNGSHCYAFENKGGQLVELAEFPSP